MIEAVVQAIIYTTTVIATLRAGSRALYAYTHDNEIGIMDGPLILSPQNIADLRKQGSLEGEVSPLWESSFGFSEAVRLLYDVNSLDDDVIVGNWKKEEEASGYYSLASPHKAFRELRKQEILDSMIVEDDDASTTGEGEDDNETSLVTIAPKEMDRSRGQRSTWSLVKSYFLTQSNQVVVKSKAIKSLWVEIWKCHPLLGGNPYFFKKDEYDEMGGNPYCFKRTVYEEEVEEEHDAKDEELDFDTFYTKTIDMPTLSTSDDLNSTDENDSGSQPKRVAHIKAFAPKAFVKLRKRFGVSEEALITSLLRSGPYVSFQSNSKGAARAGGFFFFSRDGAYMVKTIKVSK